ncbi:acyltransferase family protein [Chitinophaga sp. 30R24]|uniref:acyltransferase family protein n=1 Tax=Chitinophaga sp. 30R24 TaxID=3248838 RepID=UPI003B8FFB5F
MKPEKLFNLFQLPPVKSESRYAWVDYAKGIAIILVVYRHLAYGLLASGVPLPHGVTATNDMLYSFRMPLFFLLSGAFFSKSIAKRGINGVLYTKINTLLYPYLLWAIIQVSLQILFSEYANSQRSAKDYLNIFLQPRTLDQLWYLFALFNVTILYLLVTLALKEKKIGQLAVGLGLLGCAPYVQNFSALYDVALHYIFFAIGDLAARYFFREETQTWLSNPKHLLMALPVFGALQWYYLYHQQMNLYLFLPIALNGCLFVMLLSSWLAHTGKMEFLGTIGHYSLYIYLLHVSIAAQLRAVLLEMGFHQGLLLLLFLIPVAIYLSIIAYKGCMMLGLSFLFSGKTGAFKTVKKAGIS